jgi:hypothetical protein
VHKWVRRPNFEAETHNYQKIYLNVTRGFNIANEFKAIKHRVGEDLPTSWTAKVKAKLRSYRGVCIYLSLLR